MKSLGLWAIIFFSHFSQAAVISPSSEELNFKYEATFFTGQEGAEVGLAEQHAQHLFGYLQSPSLVRKFKINLNTMGIGAPKLPLKFKILKVDTEQELRQITYRASGKILLNKKAAQALKSQNQIEITMPNDLDNFFIKKCTDSYYNSIGDFWYFYDPFRAGCERLRSEPLAAKTTIVFEQASPNPQDAPAGFDQIRGDNGNGDLIQITTINGFAEDSKKPKDDGRLAYQQMNSWLLEQGFEQKIIARYFNRPIYQFEKIVSDSSGKTKIIRITRLLAETSSESRNVTFAKFFQKAVFEADVIIYAGHSGLGSYLDIDNLEAKSGPLIFNPKKRQIFYFDGCSSYSYYLSMFEKRKPKSRIDILTNGLSSLFGYENPSHQRLIREIMDLDSHPNWLEVLTKMEKPLRGMTFMLNVGGI